MRVSLLAIISALFAAFIIAPVAGQNSLTIANDQLTLNYALVLERLEAAYYQCYLYPLNNTNTDCAGRGYNAFSQADFAAAGFNTSVWNAVNLIAAQEAAHVAFLVSVITNPVPRCIYNLNALPGNPVINSVVAFMNVSRVLENTGVSAYAGAVNTLTNPDLQQAAVQIASVEARHASWLNQLLGFQPFDSIGYDTYRTPAEIVATIGGIFQNSSCYTTLPTTRPYGVAGVGTSGTNQTGPLAGAAGASYSAAQRANDIKLLNYALTLELLESNFYNAAFLIYNQASFVNAGLPASAFSFFGIIRDNENNHVSLLRAVVSAYGGTPVNNCTYNFTSALSSFQNFVNTAQTLENAGTWAYAGAANTITDTNLQRVAATIAMIEARHAAYLNVYNVSIPNNSNAFPLTQDLALTPTAVVAFLTSTGLVVSCPSPSPYSDASLAPAILPYGAGIPSSSGAQQAARSSSSSSGGNGAASSASFSMAMIVVAMIASLALVL